MVCTTNNEKIMRNGAQCLVAGLRKSGVEVIFGYPGGTVLPIFDALLDSGIRFVLARHEQGAVHMADGYARSTGRVGCCLVTSGPGATNTVTGLATANMDGIPLVCVCGQVPLSKIGNDSFQEADTTGITLSVTKHNFLIRSADDVPHIVAEAFKLATSGRHGPVLIDIPNDIQSTMTDALTVSPDDISIHGHFVIPKIPASDIRRLASLIEKSERPVLYTGAGVIAADAISELREVAEQASIPVTTTLMGIGSFPANHRLALGMVGMHGSVASNLAIEESDLLICAGARFDDRATGKAEEFAPRAKVVHIDIDKSAIGKSIRTDFAINGDVKAVFTTLLKYIKPATHKNWLGRIDSLKQESTIAVSQHNSGGLLPQYVIQCLDGLCSVSDFIVTDVGQNQMWAAQYMTHIAPHHFITSGGLGTMGFGLPAAIGAQFGNRGQRVVCIAGDGGIQMNFQELVVAVEHHLPVKVIVLNNTCLGMVRQYQQLFCDKRYSSVMLGQFDRNRDEDIDERNDVYLPDFVKLAEAHGAHAARITRADEVKSAISRAFADDNVWLLEFRVVRDANVLPIIPSGCGVGAMLRD